MTAARRPPEGGFGMSGSCHRRRPSATPLVRRAAAGVRRGVSRLLTYGFRHRALTWRPVRRVLLTLAVLAATALVVSAVEPLRTALGHASARRRRRASGAASRPRRGRRARGRRADPRARGRVLPGRDRQRDRGPGLRLLGRVPARDGRVAGVGADRVLARRRRRAPARGAARRRAAGRRRRAADRPRRRAGAAPLAARSRSCPTASSATSPAPRASRSGATLDVVRRVLPITAAATYLGHALDDFSASDPLLWVAAAGSSCSAC